MEQNVVVLVKSDPEKSHRPVEAIRIALGLVSSDHQVSIILLEKAPFLLSDRAESLMDGEDLEEYLSPLKELGQTFYVEKESLNRVKIDDPDCKIVPLPMTEIARLVESAERHLIF